MVLVPLSLPGLVLNAPVLLHTQRVAKREMAKAVAGSRVKLAGRDVVASKAIVTAITTVPLLYLVYLAVALALWNVCEVSGPGCPSGACVLAPMAIVLLALPVYSLVAVYVGETAGRNLRALRPAVSPT